MSNQKLVNGVASGLAWELKYIRKACGMTLDDVCLKLKWPLSKLSRMEGGQQCISEADLASVLVLYQVHGKERQRLLHLAERQMIPVAGRPTCLRQWQTRRCSGWSWKPARLSMPNRC